MQKTLVKSCRKRSMGKWIPCRSMSKAARELLMGSFKQDPNHPVDKQTIGEVCQVIDALGGDFRWVLNLFSPDQRTD